jgi:hypothetical protein
MSKYLCPALIGLDPTSPGFDGGGHAIATGPPGGKGYVCHKDAGGCGAELVEQPEPEAPAPAAGVPDPIHMSKAREDPPASEVSHAD